MEQHKDWYLSALLSRVSSTCTPDSTAVQLKKFIKSMKILEGKTRDCYSEPINLSSDEFVEMILLDSCFIVELFIRKHENGKGTKFESDPIFKTAWMMESLQRDLILLENQLPFFVLKDIFKDLELRDLSLSQLVVNFFGSMISSFGLATQESYTVFGECKHFLDLLHNILVHEPENSNERSSDGSAAKKQSLTTRCQHVLHLPCNYLSRGKASEDETTPRTWEYIHYATELREAGVNFKKKTGATSLLNITFDNNGVLGIPPIKLTNYTDPLLRNLVALEQCNEDYGCGITSYAALLDSLISTKRDVKLLRIKKIIDCGLDEHDKAALAFNKLGDGVMVRDFYFADICSKVNKYYRTDWHRWRSILKREYFKNPWASISILVAFVIMALSLAQTVFSILSYYNRE